MWFDTFAHYVKLSVDGYIMYCTISPDTFHPTQAQVVSLYGPLRKHIPINAIIYGIAILQANHYSVSIPIKANFSLINKVISVDFAIKHYW